MQGVRRFTSAHGIAVVALVLALGGGTVYAAAKIGAGDIRKGAVRSKQIRNGAVKTPDLGKRAVKRGKIGRGAVGLRQLGVAASWQPVALAAGYAPFAATNTSFGAPECFRDPFGIVHLRGAAENTGTGTTRVGELPPACWVETGAAANRFDEFLVTRLNALGVGQAAEPAYVDADTGEIFLENPVADNTGVSLAGVGLGN
jgi:hypothetical protein